MFEKEKKDTTNKKEQVIQELKELRQRADELEGLVVQHEQTEERIRESEELFRNIFENAKDGLIFLDKYGKILKVNEQAVQIFGGLRREVLGKHFTKLGVFPLKNIPLIISAFKEALTRNKITLRKVYIKNKKNQEMYIESSSTPIKKDNKITGLLVIVRDITERIQTEEKLRESEEKYRASFKKSRDAINIFSKEREILDFNQKLIQLSGYSKEELLSMKLQDLYPEASQPITKKRIQDMLKGKIPPIFETYLLTKKRKKIPVGVAVTSLKNCYDRKVVFQGNVRDISERTRVENELEKHRAHLEELVEERTAELKKINEQLQKEIFERKRAEEVLRESEEKFRSMSASAQDAIIMINNDGNISYWNDAARNIFGYSKKEAIGKNLNIIIPEEHYNGFKKGFSAFRKTGKGPKVKKTLELTSRRKDGTEFPLELSLASVRIKGKWNAIGIVRDISERKQAEEALVESEKRFKELWNNAPVAYHTLDTKGTITSVNQTEAKMLGYIPKKMVGKSIFDFILPEQCGEARKRFKRKIFGNHILRDEDRIYVKKDGSKLHVMIDDNLERGVDGKVLGVRTTMVDVTDRRHIEEALQESKEKYQTLSEAAIDGIYVISPEGFEYVNPAFEKIFGYKAKEVCNKEFDFFDLIHPEDRKLVKKREQARKNGRKLPPEYSFRILTKDGKTKHVEVNTVPLPGRKIRVLGILRDISKRTHAEEALRESEERYKTLVQTSPDAVTVTDLMGNITYVSPRTIELHGFNNAEELLGSSAFDLIAPEDHERARPNLEKTLKNGIIREVEYTLLRRDGTRFVGELNCAVIKDAEGNPKMFIATTRDITEREKAKKVIKESEERFRDLVEKAGIAILIDDKDTRLKYCNKKYAELFGYSLEAMKKQTIRTLIHPDDINKVMKYHKDRVRGKKAPSRYECRGIKKDGSTIYIEIDAVALKEGGKIIGTRSYIWDITERKHSEEALQTSEEKFKTLFNSASDAIFIHDLSGRFLEVNQVACERLGYNRDELLKMALKDIDSPRLSTVVPARDEELGKRGHIFYETVHKGRDGTVIPIELSSRIIEYKGEPVALSIARDITERKRAEEERKKSFERLRKALEETVNALASAVEMRDPYTAGHQQRVTNLAIAIAREMRLSQERIEGIRMAGAIHDVGKIRVPAEILSWPGRLTDIDFNLIKTHPQVGFDILKRIELPYSVTEIMLQHHERMDGSGYPAGLQGEEILLEARILAVADVVEAMASHRPYRAALGVRKALEEISKNRGILYDVEVVDVCLKLFTEKNFRFR